MCSPGNLRFFYYRNLHSNDEWGVSASGTCPSSKIRAVHTCASSHQLSHHGSSSLYVGPPPAYALGERCGCAKRFLSRCDCKRFKRSMKGFCGERAGVSRVSCYIFHVELSQKTNFWLIVARGVSALEISLFVLRTLSLYCNEFLKPVKTEHIQRIIIYLKQNSIYF